MRTRRNVVEVAGCAWLVLMFYDLTIISGAGFPSHVRPDIAETSVGPRIASDMLLNLFLNDIARSGHASKSLLHI